MQIFSQYFKLWKYSANIICKNPGVPGIPPNPVKQKSYHNKILPDNIDRICSKAINLSIKLKKTQNHKK